MQNVDRDQIKNWHAFYPLYFNSDYSTRDGRRVVKKYSVKNPRCDEILEALMSLGIRGIVEMVSLFLLLFQSKLRKVLDSKKLI